MVVTEDCILKRLAISLCDCPDLCNARIAEIVSFEYSRLEPSSLEGMILEKFEFEHSAILCVLLGKRFRSVTSDTRFVQRDIHIQTKDIHTAQYIHKATYIRKKYAGGEHPHTYGGNYSVHMEETTNGRTYTRRNTHGGTYTRRNLHTKEPMYGKTYI